MHLSHAHASTWIALILTLLAAMDAKAEGNQSQIAAGHAFARKVCWVCHIVAKDQTEQPILYEPGPSFLSIARRSDRRAVS
jgi:cytochrome c2